MTISSFASNTSIPQRHRLKVSCVNSRLENIEQVGNHIRGTIDCLGRGTIGFAPRKKITRAERDYDLQSQSVVSVEYLDIAPETGEYKDTTTTIKQKNSPSPLPCQRFRRVASEKRVALGLTRAAKKKIEEGCFLMERRFGLKGLGFYTLTLPTEDPQHIEAFNLRAAECLKRFFEKMRRLYEKRAAKFEYVGVWELHPGRSTRCQLPILHVHFVAPCRLEGSPGFVATSGEIRNAWSDCVRRVIGVSLLPDARIGSEILRKSAAGYLSKYMSKPATGDGGGKPVLPTVSLSSWASISSNLIRCIRASRINVGGLFGHDIGQDDIGEMLNRTASRFGAITAILNERVVTLGYWFDVADWVFPIIDQVASEAIGRYL